MKGELRDDADNQKILLDFSPALASLFAFLFAVALTVGPWLLNFRSAVLYTMGFLVVLWVAYRTGVQAAIALSRTMRAACDIFRFDLLSALGVAMPKDLADERQKWERLSTLAAYGYGHARNIVYDRKQTSSETS
jgi:hypothetical protein